MRKVKKVNKHIFTLFPVLQSTASSSKVYLIYIQLKKNIKYIERINEILSSQLFNWCFTILRKSQYLQIAMNMREQF